MSFLSLEEENWTELPKAKKRQEKESNINHVVYYLYNKVYKLVFVLLFSKIIGNIVIVFECT